MFDNHSTMHLPPLSSYLHSSKAIATCLPCTDWLDLLLFIFTRTTLVYFSFTSCSLLLSYLVMIALRCYENAALIRMSSWTSSILSSIIDITSFVVLTDGGSLGLFRQANRSTGFPSLGRVKSFVQYPSEMRWTRYMSNDFKNSLQAYISQPGQSSSKWQFPSRKVYSAIRCKFYYLFYCNQPIIDLNYSAALPYYEPIMQIMPLLPFAMLSLCYIDDRETKLGFFFSYSSNSAMAY